MGILFLKHLNSRRSISVFFISVILFFGMVDLSSAWVIGEPLVPCGGRDSDGSAQPQCSQCEILHLVDNVVDFIMIALAPIIATLFFVVAGVYIMLGGANPGMLSQGKRIFTETMVGLLIVMLAWLITNTFILALVRDSFNIYPDGFDFDSADWWELACDTISLDDVPPGSGGGGPTPTPAPPVIVSNEQAINITRTSATITWGTNAPATSQVHWGPCNAMINYSPNPPNNNPSVSHFVSLSGLGSGFTFCYEVRSTRNGYTAVGSIRQFTTLP